MPGKRSENLPLSRSREGNESPQPVGKPLSGAKAGWEGGRVDRRTTKRP